MDTTPFRKVAAERTSRPIILPGRQKATRDLGTLNYCNTSSFLGAFSYFLKSAYYLRHVRPSVRMYQRAAATGQISVKFDSVDVYENTAKNLQNLVKNGQKYRALYMKT